MAWSGRSEGGALGYRIFVYTIKYLGIGFAYFILQFVSFYYFLFLKKKKKHLSYLYEQRLNFSYLKSSVLIKKNFLLFGQGLIDKTAFLIGKGKGISYEEEGEKYLRELIENKKGAILISGHLGNWDIAGNFLSSIGAKVNVLMYQNEKEQVQKVLDKEGGAALFNIIPISDDMSHVIQVYSALKKGEFICLHADRFLEGTKTLSIPFLGEEALFPIGIFQMIEKFKAAYSFVFMVKKGKYHYSFSATKPIEGDKSAKDIALSFVSKLEEKVKLYPEQWFNYYDFYKK